MTRRCTSALFLCLLLATTLWGQDVRTRVDEYFTHLAKLQRFSGTVLFAKDGQILLSKGYGLANHEWDIPNTPQTKFRLGSITKQFTAMAIMQLEERGLLKVDDPIIKYVPDYPKATGEKITIHHLLTHTSGIPNFTSFPEYQKTMMSPSPAEKTLDRFKDKPLDFTPGEKFNYSNSGYVLLGLIVEKVSGKAYDVFLQENIFGPLGMKNTGYEHWATVLKNRASGYDYTPKGLVNPAYLDMTIPGGAGALYSTVEDLYLWDQALYTEKLVKKATMERIVKPWISAGPQASYGYGWMLSTLSNHKAVAHGGGINGFSTLIARFPEDRATFIFLRNVLRPGGPNLQRDMAALLFGDKVELFQEKVAVKVDPKIYDAYVGRYELRPDFVFTVTREGDRLMTQVTNQPKIEVRPLSETRFFAVGPDAEISFSKNEKGEVDKLILHQGGRDQPAKRLPN